MSSPERRTSMAERRPSFFAFQQATPLLVPHLAGIEDPLPETTPENVDVLIVGTGIVESVLAAALAWQGSNVLHVDSNDYYGDSSATLTVEQIKRWVSRINDNKIPCFKNAKLYVSNDIGPTCKYKSRSFGIDLSPKIMFAKSDLLSILVKSRVYQYLEFQALSTFHTFENDSFEKLSNSKQEIFTNDTLPLMTKRNLMKFLKFVLSWEQQPEIWEPYKDRSLADLLAEKFKLERPQIFELIFSIGLCYNTGAKIPESFQRIRRFLISFDVYGPFPVLYSKYGGAGEISQGFCRSAAVAGATYKLNEKLVSYNPETKTAIFEDGSKVKVEEKLVMSPSQAPDYSYNMPEQKYEVHRLTCVVEKDCREWFTGNESAAVIVFPPNSLKSGNQEVVQAIIVGSGSECCPDGTCIWYLSTTQQGPRAELDLDAALEAMEISIIRESSAKIPQDESLVEVSEDGHSTINSFKLGQSFKEYVEREKVQFLFKLYYTQCTTVPPFNVVDPSLFTCTSEFPSKFIPNASDNGVIYTTMPSSEISYDEVITAAKVIYEQIVGSDDDFFDIDFEDEDPVASGNNHNTGGAIKYDENAIEDEEDDDIDMNQSDHDRDNSDVVGKLEI